MYIPATTEHQCSASCSGAHHQGFLTQAARSEKKTAKARQASVLHPDHAALAQKLGPAPRLALGKRFAQTAQGGQLRLDVK